MLLNYQLKNQNILAIALISLALGTCSMSLAEDSNAECEKLRVKSEQTDTQTFYPIKSFGKWYVYVSPKACWITTLSIKPITDSIHSNSSCFASSAFSLSYFIERDDLEAPQISVVTDFSLSDKYIQLYLNKAKHYIFWAKQNSAWPYQSDDHIILEQLIANPYFNIFYSSESKPKKIRMESYTNYGFRRALQTVNMKCPFLGLTTQRKTYNSFKTAYLKD